MEPMKAFILCAGAGARWGNYLGVPKQLIPLENETVLERTVRLLHEQNLTDIVIVATTAKFAVHRCQLYPPDKARWTVETLLSTRQLWAETNIILLGDVFYSKQAIHNILYARGDIRFFGRPYANKLTGNPRAELFALKFRKTAEATVLRHGKRVLYDALAGGRGKLWQLYRSLIGGRLNEKQVETTIFHIIDDITDDFDFPEDYDRFMRCYRPQDGVTHKNHEFVFIGGLQRSGTTLLFRCLRDHPQISGIAGTKRPVDEGQFIQTVYPRDNVYGGPGRFAFDPAAHLDESSTLATAANAAKLCQEWGGYWDLTKPILIEKTPHNLIQSRFLQALFPQAKFIMIIRHPVAVTFATQKIWGGTVHTLLEHWLRSHEIFTADKARLRHVFTLKYEDFVAHPAKILAELFAFLGLKSVPLQQDVKKSLNQSYLDRWRAAKEKAFPGDYVNYPYLLDIFEKRVNRYGYSLII